MFVRLVHSLGRFKHSFGIGLLPFLPLFLSFRFLFWNRLSLHLHAVTTRLGGAALFPFPLQQLPDLLLQSFSLEGQGSVSRA